MFISITNISSYWSKLGLEELEFLMYNLFCVLCWDFWCHACSTGKCALLILFNVPIYYPLGECKLSICSFLEYCYTIAVFMHSVLCLSKDVWCVIKTQAKFFSALNLTIAFSTFHFVITIFSVSFLNELLFLH